MFWQVYRNETLDTTHLAEFHQVEGIVADYGISLGHLIGVINDFFCRMGLPRVRFKPAYNPYTEPSMEIFCYHIGLGKWIEVNIAGLSLFYFCHNDIATKICLGSQSYLCKRKIVHSSYSNLSFHQKYKLEAFLWTRN